MKKAFERVEFERVTPESVGISSEGVLRLIDALEGGHTEMHGLMIMRHGKVCAEGWWAPYAPGMHHMCASLTKTYMGTAIGIAIREGILGLDDKLIDIFPEYMPENPSPWIDKLTVRNVLRMGAGMVAFPEMEGYWVKNYIAMPLVHEPGTSFFYNSVGSTMLGKIIEKKTGKDVYTYLAEKLFCKIGIDAENVDHGIAPEGEDMWAWRTISTTEDNLRLMKLYANGGCWDGERILDEDYVAMATTSQIDNSSPEALAHGAVEACSGYGFQMWMCSYPGAYRADGAGGQYSVVIPSKDMIISINENAFGGADKTLKCLWDFIEDAVKDEPMPEDTPEVLNGQKLLTRRLRHLSIEAPEYRPYSRRKKSANGKYKVLSGSFEFYCAGMYLPESNPIEYLEINFDVMDGTMKWISKDRTSLEIEFALDGSRRYNNFASPWQFAKICYINGVWESDDRFRLEQLWPENNSTKTMFFTFTDEGVVVSETKGGLPGQPIVTVETVCEKM